MTSAELVAVAAEDGHIQLIIVDFEEGLTLVHGFVSSGILGAVHELGGIFAGALGGAFESAGFLAGGEVGGFFVKGEQLGEMSVGVAGEDELSGAIQAGMVGPAVIEVLEGGGGALVFIRYLYLEIDNEFPRCLMISDKFIQKLSLRELFYDLCQ